MIARVFTGFALARAIPLLPANRIAEVAIALTYATLLPVGKPKAGNVDMGNGNGDDILPLSTDELAVRYVPSQILANFAANDIAKARVILIDPEAHVYRRGWRIDKGASSARAASTGIVDGPTGTERTVKSAQ